MTSRLTILVAVAALALGAPALAFHDGGVAHCNGCHTMHNSQNSAAMNFAADGSPGGTPVGTGFPDLLLFGNKTDVCLRCHAGDGGYHVWSDDVNAPSSSALRGAGDFVFLEEDNINDAHAGATNPVLGESAGHSVISAMKGTAVDSMNATGPGGNYDSNNMHCTSCHDPHGTAAYRILYQAGQAVDNVTYTATIDADGISVFAGPENPGNHNAYHSGYSDWCATCHGDFHQASGALVHPSGEAMDDVANVYNAYNGTEDCILNPPTPTQPCGSGLQATAYLHEVPFEDAATTTSSTAGPTASSLVSCVSCHRAHATSAMDAGRWDFNVTGLAEDGAESGSWAIPDPYGSVYQRSLCNKCHSKDEFDALVDFS